ncbi:hypothetical protein [Proteiniborus sp.]|uniref:hypothetical protein n=1 Tax=Proteiniborus sp. TaxID=2079015 RepID=UPI003316CAAF
MTHTLHRSGTYESLSDDYVLFAIAAQTVNAKGIAPQFKKFADIVLKYDPINFGDMKTGNVYGVGLEEIQKGYKDNSIVHAVFKDQKTLIKALEEVKDANLDLSIVLSGIIEHTNECCCKNDITPHTIEHSLGIHGKLEYLPEEEVIEVSTMCGHGMVAFSLIEDLSEKVAKGKITAEKAAEKLAKQCHCGIFNTSRAERLIASIAESLKG